MAAATQSVTVALDWTPNTNHTGFYVARAKGWYAEAGLSVQLRSPHTDGYSSTPAANVADGGATFACTPSESIVSHHTWPGGAKPKLVAVAALLQDPQLSAIVTLKSSGITRPAQLDGKRYASYAARYESRIVQALIRADGGSGAFTELTPPMLGIWNTLLDGSSDATWVFMPWEGVAAARAGIELNAFKLGDFGIPYCYSPVLAVHPQTLQEQPELVRSFLAATARGFEWAAQHPAEAAQVLCESVAADVAAAGMPPLPEPLDPAMVAASQAVISPAYVGRGGKWGRMDTQVWSGFLDWLSEHGLLTSTAQSRSVGVASTQPDGSSSSTTFTSLEGMLGGEAGEPIPRDSIDAAALATNAFLPTAA